MQRTGSQGPPAVGGFAQTPQLAQEPPTTPASGAESGRESASAAWNKGVIPQ
jgi:hypothetical protein